MVDVALNFHNGVRVKETNDVKLHHYAHNVLLKLGGTAQSKKLLYNIQFF